MLGFAIRCPCPENAFASSCAIQPFEIIPCPPNLSFRARILPIFPVIPGRKTTGWRFPRSLSGLSVWNIPANRRISRNPSHALNPFKTHRPDRRLQLETVRRSPPFAFNPWRSWKIPPPVFPTSSFQRMAVFRIRSILSIVVFPVKKSCPARLRQISEQSRIHWKDKSRASGKNPRNPHFAGIRHRVHSPNPSFSDSLESGRKFTHTRERSKTVTLRNENNNGLRKTQFITIRQRIATSWTRDSRADSSFSAFFS